MTFLTTAQEALLTKNFETKQELASYYTSFGDEVDCNTPALIPKPHAISRPCNPAISLKSNK
jgi:hypothetical protein